MTPNHTPAGTGHEINVQDTKDKAGHGHHPMIQDLHYTGDDTKLHKGRTLVRTEHALI